MKGSRTKDKDKAAVIAAKLREPDLTLREIAEDTWINRETARKILDKDLPEVVQSSDRIAAIIENDLEAVSNMSELAKLYSWHLLNKAKIDKFSVERSDIAVANTVTADSFKRSQLLSGWATDRVEVIGDVNIL